MVDVDIMKIEDKYNDTFSIIQESTQNLDSSSPIIVQTTSVSNANNNSKIELDSQKFTKVKPLDITIAPFCRNIFEWQSFFETVLQMYNVYFI